MSAGVKNQKPVPVIFEGGFEVKQGAEFEIEITDNNTVVL